MRVLLLVLRGTDIEAWVIGSIGSGIRGGVVMRLEAVGRSNHVCTISSFMRFEDQIHANRRTMFPNAYSVVDIVLCWLHREAMSRRVPAGEAILTIRIPPAIARIRCRHPPLLDTEHASTPSPQTHHVEASESASDRPTAAPRNVGYACRSGYISLCAPFVQTHS
jgi:hypothetical protein